MKEVKKRLKKRKWNLPNLEGELEHLWSIGLVWKNLKTTPKNAKKNKACLSTGDGGGPLVCCSTVIACSKNFSMLRHWKGSTEILKQIEFESVILIFYTAVLVAISK